MGGSTAIDFHDGKTRITTKQYSLHDPKPQSELAVLQCLKLTIGVICMTYTPRLIVWDVKEFQP